MEIVIKMIPTQDGGQNKNMGLSDLGKQVDDIFQKGMNSKELDTFRTGIDDLIKDVRTWTVDNVSQYTPKDWEKQNKTGSGQPSQSARSSSYGSGTYQRVQDKGRQYAERVRQGRGQAVQQVRNEVQARRASYNAGAVSTRSSLPRAGAVNMAPTVARRAGNVSGVLLTVFGSIGTAGFGIPYWILLMMDMAGEVPFTVSMVNAMMFFPLTLASVIMLWGGIKKLKFNGRFNRYLQTFGGKAYCSIRDLAIAVGKKESLVLKDIRKAVRKGLLRQAHLDDKKTCLILTDEMYKTYMDTQLNAKKLELEEKHQSQKEEEAASQKKQLSAEEAAVQSVIEEGGRYIKQIKEANDAIASPEVSEKLYRLETIITKIFGHIQKNPGALPETRKFIEYYMPTTLKLVNAYREFDAQPIQGDNIIKSKKEIESTLDTINEAFVNLFDSLFEDVAMDISTDISVLQTMLAQEGLTGRDFDKEK